MATRSEFILKLKERGVTDPATAKNFMEERRKTLGPFDDDEPAVTDTSSTELPANEQEAIIKQESGGNPNAVSKKGAVGLMQIMPETAKEIASELGEEYTDTSLTDPDTNKRWGTYYFKKNKDSFLKQGADNDTAIKLAAAAYHAGPGKAQKIFETWKDTGVFNIPRTQKFFDGDKYTADYAEEILQKVKGAGDSTESAPPSEEDEESGSGYKSIADAVAKPGEQTKPDVLGTVEKTEEPGIVQALFPRTWERGMDESSGKKEPSFIKRAFAGALDAASLVPRAITSLPRLSSDGESYIHALSRTGGRGEGGDAVVSFLEDIARAPENIFIGGALKSVGTKVGGKILNKVVRGAAAGGAADLVQKAGRYSSDDLANLENELKSTGINLAGGVGGEFLAGGLSKIASRFKKKPLTGVNKEVTDAGVPLRSSELKRGFGEEGSALGAMNAKMAEINPLSRSGEVKRQKVIQSYLDEQITKITKNDKPVLQKGQEILDEITKMKGEVNTHYGEVEDELTKNLAGMSVKTVSTAKDLKALLNKLGAVDKKGNASLTSPLSDKGISAILDLSERVKAVETFEQFRNVRKNFREQRTPNNVEQGFTTSDRAAIDQAYGILTAGMDRSIKSAPDKGLYNRWKAANTLYADFSNSIKDLARKTGIRFDNGNVATHIDPSSLPSKILNQGSGITKQLWSSKIRENVGTEAISDMINKSKKGGFVNAQKLLDRYNVAKANGDIENILTKDQQAAFDHFIEVADKLRPIGRSMVEGDTRTELATSMVLGGISGIASAFTGNMTPLLMMTGGLLGSGTISRLLTPSAKKMMLKQSTAETVDMVTAFLKKAAPYAAKVSTTGGIGSAIGYSMGETNEERERFAKQGFVGGAMAAGGVLGRKGFSKFASGKNPLYIPTMLHSDPDFPEGAFSSRGDKAARFEISDKAMTIKPEGIKALIKDKEIDAASLIDHPEIEEDIQLPRVFIDEKLKKGQANFSNAGIGISEKDLKDEKGLKKSILHELQHYFQKTSDDWGKAGEAGMAQGTNVQAEKDILKKLRGKEDPLDLIYSAQNYYRNLGEIEARDAAERIDLTPEERSKKMPYKDEVNKLGLTTSDVAVAGKEGDKSVKPLGREKGKLDKYNEANKEAKIIHKNEEVNMGSLIAKSLGIRYDGVQQGFGSIPNQFSFSDPVTHASFTANSFEEAVLKLSDKRRTMKKVD